MQIESLKAKGGFGSAFIGEALMRLLPESFDWLGWPFLVLGLFLLLSAAYEWIFNRLGWRLRFQNNFFWPIFITIPLNKAGIKSWEALEDTDLISTWQVLNMGGRSGDKRMYWWYKEIIDPDKGNVDLYGTRPPSTKNRIIDRTRIEEIDDNGMYASVKGYGDHKFENLRVPKHQINTFIKNRKS